MLEHMGKVLEKSSDGADNAVPQFLDQDKASNE